MGCNLKKIVGIAGIAAAGLGGAWLVRNRYLFNVCDVTTGESPHYPELRAHVYFALAPAAGNAVEAAIRSFPNWRQIAVSETGTKLQAEVENPITGFLSDVFITLVPLGPRHTRVVIRSKSRLCDKAGDLGENARIIRQLQAKMDSLLIGG